MQALYALIESPPEPSFGPGEFVGDEEAFEALREYECPAGVKTQMYKYQIVSPLAPLTPLTTALSVPHAADGDDPRDHGQPEVHPVH